MCVCAVAAGDFELKTLIKDAGISGLFDLKATLIQGCLFNHQHWIVQQKTNLVFKFIDKRQEFKSSSDPFL